MATTEHRFRQRLASPSLLGLSSFAASFKYLIDNPTQINASYGWHFQYLTIIGLSLATITFVLGASADLTCSARLFRMKNTLSMCTTPLEVLISILYWGISAVDKRLVVPEWAVMSYSADLGFHLIPSVLLALDFFLFSPPWTISVSRAVALSGSIAILYWFWVEQCYRYNGLYPYPLFDSLTVPWRVQLFAISALSMTGSTIALKGLHKMINA